MANIRWTLTDSEAEYLLGLLRTRMGSSEAACVQATGLHFELARARDKARQADAPFTVERDGVTVDGERAGNGWTLTARYDCDGMMGGIRAAITRAVHPAAGRRIVNRRQAEYAAQQLALEIAAHGMVEAGKVAVSRV